MDLRVAQRYARALFAAAQKASAVDVVDADFQAVVGAMDRDPKFEQFLANPNVPRSEKAALLGRVFGDRISASALNMLRLLLDKRREQEIRGVAAEFTRLRREYEAVLFAKITSAKPLEDEHKAAIVTKLQSATRKRIEAEYILDPAVIGGVKVDLGGYVLDGTVTGALARLKEALVYDLLKQN